MFVTDSFVFLHLPKTAGVYFESVCLENLRFDIKLSRRHAKYSELPSEYSNLPTIGVWRDPWSWYASLYYFAKLDRNRATGDLIGLASDNFNLSFAQTLPRLLSPDDDFIKSYEIYMCASNGKVKDFECMDKSSLYRAKKGGLGLQSFLASEIFPKNLDIEWQMDTLKKEMFLYLGEICSNREKFREAMVSPPRNVSNKPGLELIYTKELIEMVAAAEKDLISRFHYAPPKLN